MLKREFKLKSSEEIKNVLKLGRKIRGVFLTLFLSDDASEHCRAAVIVGRKVAVSAVARNRVRRVIFSDLEDRFASWGNRPISAMVVMVMNIPEDEKLLKDDLKQCFARW
ncbi:MAG: ribonuclease P protein component [Patescibacteria group bacterium]